MRMDSVCLIVHYHRHDNLYDGWYLWVWPEGQAGALFEFVEEDEFGRFCQLDCSKLTQRRRLGLLIKKSKDRWDQGREEVRFIDISRSIPLEVWLIENDPTVYYKPPTIVAPLAAFADGPKEITVNLSSLVKTNEHGLLEDFPFSVNSLPIREVRNSNPLGFKKTYQPREDGYEILEDSWIRFVFDPERKGSGERIEGSRSVYLLGTHNNWTQAEGNPRWRMKWNREEGVYELKVKGLPVDGSIKFKFKETVEDTDQGWFPGPADPPFILLGLQTRRLTIDLEKDLDLTKEYYLHDGKKTDFTPITQSALFVMWSSFVTCHVVL